MILTDENIDYISKNLELYGLKNQELKEDILDHICTHIENSEATNFDEVYEVVIQKFGGYLNINHIQTETNLQLHLKSAKNRNILLFTIGFINTLIIATGLFFKIMQWPFTGKILTLGFSILIVMTLPLYFYSKYKDSSLIYQS